MMEFVVRYFPLTHSVVVLSHRLMLGELPGKMDAAAGLLPQASVELALNGWES